MIKLKMHYLYKIIPALLILSLFSSCYYDNLDELHPTVVTENCDTAGMSYLNNIKPILDLNCGTTNTCHNANHSDSGIPLDSYTSLQDEITNHSGRLMGSIRHEPGFAAMPQSGGKLSNCNISKIQAWINQGMLDN